MSFELGVAPSDQIAVGVTAMAQVVTYAAWVNRQSNGGGNLGRISDKRDGAEAQAEVLFTGSNGFLLYERNRATTTGQWRTVAQPLTLNTWVHVAVTMDNALTTNDPIFYINGAAVSITEVATPVGAVIDNASEHIIGNRATDGARNWDGYLAHVAKWDAILTPSQIAPMGRSPFALSPQYYPANAVFYLPLEDAPAYDVYGNTVTVTGGQFVNDDPSLIFPGELGGYAVGLAEQG